MRHLFQIIFEKTSAHNPGKNRDQAPVVQRVDNFIHRISRFAQLQCVQEFRYSPIIVYRVEASVLSKYGIVWKNLQELWLEYILSAR